MKPIQAFPTVCTKAQPLEEYKGGVGRWQEGLWGSE